MLPGAVGRNRGAANSRVSAGVPHVETEVAVVDVHAKLLTAPAVTLGDDAAVNARKLNRHIDVDPRCKCEFQIAGEAQAAVVGHQHHLLLTPVVGVYRERSEEHTSELQ